MSSLCSLHQQAAQHFDERFIRKQSESFLSQPEHTIWVPRHRTLRTQYLHLGVFLWKQYKILASYKIPLQVEVFIYVLLYFMLSLNMVFKDIKIFWTVYSRVVIRYQCNNLDWMWIWCAAFNFSCIASCNLTETCNFFGMSFLS